ncbi:Radical SAM domain protein [hydrothermal vent metagenome]|uniref:Radical SAM domain protein n=1 Tax=hydrothermal vent metagenome TaxID=652676 RepID=A0A3B0VWU9_9ZZZZ
MVKLKDIATNMYLEPAEETNLRPAPQVAPCGQVVTSRNSPNQQDALGISHAVMPGGKTMPMLKTLLTSACERNCFYCPFRAGRRYRRHTFKPEEMAKTFMQLYRAGLVKGLFLSSGIIKGSVATQDRLLKTADILRKKYQFQGYLHLKIMPGAEKAQLRQAMTLADRLSVNLEAPNDKWLAKLAPKKTFFAELVRPLQSIEQIRQEEPARLGWNGRWPSTTTQFVVGGTDETDVEILATTEYLTHKLQLKRAYFSAFSPIHDTPLENRPAENPLRKVRLYQTSFLFRDYGFDLEEMAFDQQGNLSLNIDPKLAWAQANLQHEPLELNQAARHELLRVPGIGPKHSRTILNARRRGHLSDLHHLRQLGIATKRLAPYVLLDGKRPSFQLPLLIDD